MIVRTSNQSKIETVCEMYDRRLVTLDHVHSARSAVGELHCREPRNSAQLVGRNLAWVAGYGEDQNWVTHICPSGSARHRIVPLALSVQRRREVQSEHDDVLVTVACLECREQNSCSSCPHRVARHSVQRPANALVV